MITKSPDVQTNSPKCYQKKLIEKIEENLHVVTKA